MGIKDYTDGIKRCWKIDTARTRQSFSDTWQLAKEGKPGQFAVKAGGVGLGCAIVAAGVVQLAKVPNDRIADGDAAHPEKTHPNYVRAFVGGMSLFLGALGTYIAATSGMRRL